MKSKMDDRSFIFDIGLRHLIRMFFLTSLFFIGLPICCDSQSIKIVNGVELEGNDNTKVAFGFVTKTPVEGVFEAVDLENSLSINENYGNSYNVDDYKQFLPGLKLEFQQVLFDKKVKWAVVSTELLGIQEINSTKFSVLGNLNYETTEMVKTPEKDYDVRIQYDYIDDYGNRYKKTRVTKNRLLIRTEVGTYYLIRDDLLEIFGKVSKADSVIKQMPNYILWNEAIDFSEVNDYDKQVSYVSITGRALWYKSNEDSENFIEEGKLEEDIYTIRIPTKFKFEIVEVESEWLVYLDFIPTDKFKLYYPVDKWDFSNMIDTILLPTDFWNSSDPNKMNAHFGADNFNLDYQLSPEQYEINYWRKKILENIDYFIKDSMSLNVTNKIWSSLDDFINKPTLYASLKTENETSLQRSHSLDNITEFLANQTLLQIFNYEDLKSQVKLENDTKNKNEKIIAEWRIKYGSKFVDAALNGEIIIGMPEEMLSIPLRVWSITSRNEFSNGFSLICKFRLDVSKKLSITVRDGKVSSVSTW